jgi:hypothetical protein
VVARLLQKRAGDRYQSASDLHAALAPLGAGTGRRRWTRFLGRESP